MKGGVSKTLLTFLGGSRGKADAGYSETVYQWGDGSTNTTDLFAEALLKRWKPDRLVLIGTRTSAWDHLAVRINSPLYEDLIESCSESGKGISDEEIFSLCDGLKTFWGLPVELFAHDSDLSNGNALKTLMFYVDCLERVPVDHELILDLSHGFRPMPVLLLSSIRYQQALTPERRAQKVRIVYGEYGGKVSKVRNLDAIWEGMRVAESARRWFEIFSAEELCLELEGFWSEGARAIKDLGQAIQANDLQRALSPIRALGGALKRTPEESPAWFPDIFSKLHAFHHEIGLSNPAETYLALARRLARNRLIGQAYLALDEALIETVLGGRDRKELDWDEIRGSIRERLTGLGDWHPWMQEDLWKIHNCRNFIAHGGRKESIGTSTAKLKSEDMHQNFNGLSQSLEKVMHDPASPLRIQKVS